MHLFAPSDQTSIPQSTSPILQMDRWLKQEFFYKKLQTPFGYLLLVSMAMVMAWGIGTFGWEIGAILLVALLILPLLFGAMFHLRFGVYLTIVAAFCVMGLKRLTGGEISFGILLDVCLLFMGFGLLLKQIYLRDWTPLWHPFTLMILLWSVYNLIELINPLAPSQLAWLYVVRDMAVRMYVFFFVLFGLQQLSHVQAILRLWLGMGVLVALYAIVQEIVGLQAFEQAWLDKQSLRIEKLTINGWPRKFSFLGDPSSMGLCMGYTSIIGLILLQVPNQRIWQKGLTFLAIGLMWIAMILSGTRTAFMAVPATLAFLIFLSFNRGLMISLGVVLLLGLALYLVPTDAVPLERYRSTFQPSQTTSVTQLLQNQDYAQNLVRQYPIGQGLGTTGSRGQQFSPYTLLSRFPSHSGYIQIGLEMGWLGLLLYCSMLFVVLAVGVRAYMRSHDRMAKLLQLIFISVPVFLILSNYSQKALITLPSSILFPVCLAGIVLVSRWEKAGKFQSLAVLEKEQA